PEWRGPGRGGRDRRREHRGPMSPNRSATGRDDPLNIVLTGPEFEPAPADPRWVHGGEAVRRALWKHIADYATDVKRREIRKGIDDRGRKFLPVKPASRPDGAKGPPLIPHYGESRTQRLLDARS